MSSTRTYQFDKHIAFVWVGQNQVALYGMKKDRLDPLCMGKITERDGQNELSESLRKAQSAAKLFEHLR